MLSDKELLRYDRQIMIFGRDAQEKLQAARVAVVGVGGLGSPISIYLAAAGVGNLRLIDDQKPELSNLNRQILHTEQDVGNKTKAVSAEEKLHRLNSQVRIEKCSTRISANNREGLLSSMDVVVDALDNFETRYLLNDFCLKTGIPLVHAAVEGFHGQITTIVPGKTPCLRCLVPRPPKKRKFPIIGVTAGLFGILEANETIKLITGYGTPLMNRLFVFDLSRNEGETLEIKPNPACPACGEFLSS